MVHEPELLIAPFLCSKDKTTIDIGSHFGVYIAHTVHASRDCLAFEPRPELSRDLNEMCHTLSLPVRIEAVALSDKEGESELRILESDTGRSTIETQNLLEDPEGGAIVNVRTAVRRLDDYAIDDVGFLKIDVEGHELAVLQGAYETIQRCLPFVLVEVEDRHKRNACADVFTYFERIHYEGYFLFDRQLINVKNFDPAVHQNPHNISGSERCGTYINNFFFTPPGEAPRLRAALKSSALSTLS